MTLRVVNQGRAIMLEASVNKTTPQNLVLRLFQNNITPADTDTAVTYTESTFTGYASVTLTAWGAATVANPSVIAYAQQTFASTANQALQPVYGYYMTQVTSGLLVLAERDPAAPFNVSNNGDTYKVTPQITQA